MTESTAPGENRPETVPDQTPPEEFKDGLTAKHAILFLLTVFTTLFAGAVQVGANFIEEPITILAGVPFASTLLFILACHELGHFLAARKNGVRATLPYFIPAPPIIGTFGAFIRMEGRVPDKNALVEIGAMGPIAGFAVSLPAMVVGLLLSPTEHIGPVAEEALEGRLGLGSSVIMELLVWLVLGVDTSTTEILLHPVAFAAWIGFFVTALNLLPGGQLDGGHILYGISPKYHRLFSKSIVWILIPAGIFFWRGWLVWSILLMFLGRTHPVVAERVTPITVASKWRAGISAMIFILTFMPAPFSAG